jgi:hypothetical protein
MAFRKTEVNYVDVDHAGKAKPLAVSELCNVTGLKMKDMQARYDRIKQLNAEASAVRDSILADLEMAAAKVGILSADQAFVAFFNYGNFNVARIVGARHGQRKPGNAAPSNAASNVAALLASIAPAATQSRLIARRK